MGIYGLWIIAQRVYILYGQDFPAVRKGINKNKKFFLKIQFPELAFI